MISSVGLLVALVALWDVFHTLWRPSGFGRIAHWVFQIVWWTTKHVSPRRTRQLAGSIGLLGTVTVWTALVVLGGALVFGPHMPQGFHFGTALRPDESSDVIAALYLSLVNVTTLGFGDITPAHPALHVLAPVQALLGFVLLTAAISWILQVYPALGRRRTVAKRLNLLQSSRTADVVAGGDPCVASRLLDGVTDAVIQVETDLVQYTESYYFVQQDETLSLAANLPYTLTMAEAGEASSSREVRHAADMLRAAVESLALQLDSAHLRTGSAIPEVLAAFRADHGFTEDSAGP